MQKPGKKKLIQFYEKMVRIRRVEEKLMEVFSKEEIPGFIHVCIGQEATPVAVCSHLKDSDYMSNTHRGHGHALAKGIDLKLFMAEVFGKKNGFCRGRSGSMHLADRNLGILGANGIVGGGIPIATGAAFASKYKKTGQVTVCFFGEGASDEGTFHESLNIASLRMLPIVYICENNGWAQFTAQDIRSSINNVADQAAGYNISGVVVPNDFFKIYEEAGKASELLRLAGFDLSAHRSGTKSATAVPVISKKGKADLCYALYQAALVATSFNTLFRAYYHRVLEGRERENGIRTKMRVKLAAKMLIIVYPVKFRRTAKCISLGPGH